MNKNDKPAQILRELADADIALLQLNSRLEALTQPKEILAVRKKNAEFLDKLAQVTKLQKQTEREIALLQDEVAHTQTKSNEAQQHLNGSTNYKETTALTADIQSLQKRISKLEDDELILMEKLDKINSVETQASAAIEKLGAQEQKLTKEYQEQSGVIKAAIAARQQSREQLLAALPLAIAQRYEKARVAKGGIGAAHLEGEHCSACRVGFTQGQLIKLRDEVNTDSVTECPHCHRLLSV
ncbi:MAG: hypothetical protein LBG97_08870 [Coriobacteriales bacterium]|nr:hypothetical protein [Coriobacteriales bacterium]